MFLPCDYARTKGKVEPYVDRRLKHIITACYGGGTLNAPLSILDVGCGDDMCDLVGIVRRGWNQVHNSIKLSSQFID